MLSSPCDKLLVSGQYDVDQLIEHVLGRFGEKCGVRVQGLLILPIQAGAELDEALPARAGFDDRHTHSFQNEIRAATASAFARDRTNWRLEALRANHYDRQDNRATK
jgi:hypothetical protein